MFIELIDKIMLFFNESFGFDELNSDCYPENFVEINGERVKYE